MGTGKTPLWGGTTSSADYRVSSLISQGALEHSTKGTYGHPGNDPEKYRLLSGGHGQECLDFLDKHHIEYNINVVYPNGVRVGNVPSHKDSRKREGNTQSWFPPDWSSRTIQDAGEYVVNLKGNRNSKDGEKIRGVYKNVLVVVIQRNGKIHTIFPDSHQ